jgi:AcrR family transcriptional regulator
VRGTDHPRHRSAVILDAAAKVFADRGFHSASTQNIADVLGIRQASLY